MCSISCGQNDLPRLRAPQLQAEMGDLIGALAGYIGGKDARVTGQIASLPIYKGKLEKPPENKPKGEMTAKQKALNVSGQHALHSRTQRPSSRNRQRRRAEKHQGTERRS